ncbi:hypothetical protein MSAN_00648300 [Mycena sanguinolenta]|uniref:RRM domain-containing protein n=1 Tax=Mycena sanguinolenta TaxID=230812 RepID=A0A8H6Z3T2_9AGAR|nr:hypothetical protein MSAN_00648300 [Mycena sanguinolenta]
MSSSTSIAKRLHISFTPSVPANGADELARSLTAHFGKFGSVKSVDGLGELDGVGMPRKFGFISIEGSEASITKCVNSLSGSIWKGVKVRVGDARPDFDQRIKQENAAESTSPRRKRKRGAVEAADMTLVTAENAAQRPGWKVTDMGRVVRPVRMRPPRPLPPPLVTSANKIAKNSKTNAATTKPKRRRDPDSRARRRIIDGTRWGSVHLKGMFLENAGQTIGDRSQAEALETVEATHTSSDSEDDDDIPPVAGPVRPRPAPPAAKPVAVAAPATISQPPMPDSRSQVVSDSVGRPDVDLTAEKNQSLSLLNSLFGAGDDWGGRESVGSDVDEEELLEIGGNTHFDETDDPIEFVPMDVDVRQPAVAAPSPEIIEAPPTPQLPSKAPTQATKLKDLFVSKEKDTGFSLLGHLDLDLELDEELAHIIPSAEPDETPAAPPQLAATFVTPSQTHITLDPKQPLFFPLPTSFSSTSSTKARQRDILDVGKDNGWNTHFHRNETDDEIRAKWEKEKVELTREWNRRWREAGKVRRRRGGGDGD